ncbi:hypothetical protein PVAP13_2KG143500 [Panicum virgatum]|uniref:GRF-type domain-containing protein n=1 Tax=Panicum virgatum TaxID=38727 RepID=A0A8T0VY30_PANVG|nr:hypothetical protein PVAP13_2KG143500 [Panicum virgatum]
MAMPQRPSDDPDGGARHQPGAEPAAAEWLLPPPALSAIVLQSSSGGGEEEAAGPLPPPLPTAVLRSPSGGDPGRRRPSFELRCLDSLAKTYLHNAPPSAPQREVDSNTKDLHVLLASPKVIHEQSMKYAKGALEHYNQRKKIKFELTGVMPVNSMPESCNFYTHVNFTAKSIKQGSQEQFFFAELQLCSRRRASSGFLVTCCEPLGPDYTVGQKGLQLEGSAVRKNIDFTRCFACSPRCCIPRVRNTLLGIATSPASTTAHAEEAPMSSSGSTYIPWSKCVATVPEGIDVPMCFCGSLCKFMQSEVLGDDYGMRFFMCENYEYDPPKRYGKDRAKSPPPLCDFMQWFDTVQSQQAKDFVEQQARWAAEHWRRMKHEEQQEEKRKKEQEEIHKRMEEVDRKVAAECEADR